MSDIYQCETCLRRFADEAAIRGHQDLYHALHKIDPEIDEHDGYPWRRVSSQFSNKSPDLVADMVADLCTLVFERPEILKSLRPDVRFLALDRLTDDPVRAFEFGKRYGACIADGRLPHPGA